MLHFYPMKTQHILTEPNMPESSHWVLAYYHFSPIADPHGEVNLHKTFFSGRDAACRIYISEEGINGQMSAAKADAQAYIEWMHQREGFQNITFKVHPSNENVFPRITVKYRKKLVAIDTDVDLALRGDHVSPKSWKEMLENEPNKILLDVRNDYEWKIGRFEGAELPPCETFREFADYADTLKENNDPKTTPVMMYCTGGIRCELYSAILKQKGFDKIYQLNGGVIGYGLEEGSKHWQGKLFVFDDRLAVPISDKEDSGVIGTCQHCSKENDTYYNCANMDCNELFLCCPECAKKFKGCCCDECMNAGRVRPFQEHNAHKPFKRWYQYEKDLPPEATSHKKGHKK